MGLFSRKKKAKCPSCDYQFEEKPTRKKKCPNCNNYIIVRTTYKNKPKTEKILLTEEQAKKFDKEKRYYYDRKNWIRRLEIYDVTEKEFDRETERLKERFGFNPPYADVAWGIFGKKKFEYAEKKDFHNLSFICYDMAKQVYDENKPFQHQLEESAKYKIMGMRDLAADTKIEILNANDDQVCKYCRELEDKIFLLKI